MYKFIEFNQIFILLNLYTLQFKEKKTYFFITCTHIYCDINI